VIIGFSANEGERTKESEIRRKRVVMGEEKGRGKRVELVEVGEV